MYQSQNQFEYADQGRQNEEAQQGREKLAPLARLPRLFHFGHVRRMREPGRWRGRLAAAFQPRAATVAIDPRGIIVIAAIRATQAHEKFSGSAGRGRGTSAGSGRTRSS